jgi:hypothetical protein
VVAVVVEALLMAGVLEAVALAAPVSSSLKSQALSLHPFPAA